MASCTKCSYYSAESEFQLPQCQKYGTLLGISSADTPDTRASLAERIGEACASFTTDVVEQVVHLPFPVVGVAPTNMTQALEEAGDREAPTACNKCRWYVPPVLVQKEFGFEMGMCSVMAEVLSPKALLRRPRDCSFGNAGANRTSTSGVMLAPNYDLDVAVRSTAKASASHGTYDPFEHSRVDPREWPTDREVSEDDRLDGIRAWRKVCHPRGTKAPIYMPIFDWKAVGVERDPRTTYGAHQPELYIDHAGLLHQFAFLYMGGMIEGQAALNKFLMLIGEAGTGKTEFWCWVAWLMDLPFYRISCRPDTDKFEFFGSSALEVDEATGQAVTTFKPGRFTRHFATSCVICLDEPNTLPDESWLLIRPTIESATAQLVIEDQNLVIEKDPYCFTGGAINPEWVPSYRGVRPLAAADFDRIEKRYVNNPDAATERQILRNHCAKLGYDIPEATLTKIMNIAERLRELYADGGISFPWGIRANVNVAQLTWGLELEEAYQVGVTDGLEPAAQETVITVVRSF